MKIALHRFAPFEKQLPFLPKSKLARYLLKVNSLKLIVNREYENCKEPGLYRLKSNFPFYLLLIFFAKFLYNIRTLNTSSLHSISARQNSIKIIPC